MPRSRYRLNSVTVEGFKGFPGKQTISFAGKHAFLFGKDGCGKSSIVEAIRWCLFGLAERPETEVRNAYYPSGECQVELTLEAPDGMWHFRRRLRPGAERSRLAITDPNGQEVLQSQVFPYLARMGPRAGTHIIFAAQQGLSRRPQADISDFHKVLYSYLRLEEVPDLLEGTGRLLEEYQSVREDLASDIGDIEDSLRERLAQADISLEELLRNPPWIGSEVPTRSETQGKVFEFAKEMAKLSNDSLPPDTTEFEALEQTEQWCQNLASLSQGELEKKITERRSTAMELKKLLEANQEAKKSEAEAQETIVQLEEEFNKLCNGQGLEELKAELNLLDKRMMESNAKLMIAKKAEEYCRDFPTKECPVCLADYSPGELLKKTRLSIGEATPDQASISSELETLQARCDKAFKLNKKVQELKDNLQVAQREHENVLSQIRELLEISEDIPLSKENSEAQLTEIESSLQTLENSLESARSRYAELRQRIESLRSELRFHKYRKDQQRLQHQLTAGLEPMRDLLEELVELENTVRIIEETIGGAFNEAIDRALPHLNRMMTEVYHRLTGQSSFEKMYIRRKSSYSGQILEVRVGSDRVPDQLFDPEDVLNGQANSALRLVPYFVFSQFQAEALELDLLLIDDPSQSFDTSHIELLLEELANASSHAQVVVATHEDERFRPPLEKYFPVSECEVITFGEFSPEKGPSLVVQ